MSTPKDLLKKTRNALPVLIRKRLPRTISLVEIRRGDSRRLNLIYRSKNKPANVLSFRYGKDYGEILVCPGVIRREAKKQENTYKYQMTWMIIHGMLHLAGLHHEASKGHAERVEQLEALILKRLAGKNSKFKNKNLK